MGYSITHLVVHKINKEKGKRTADTICANSLLPINEEANTFLGKFLDSYSEAGGKNYGRLEIGSAFPNEIIAYIKNPEAFLYLSTEGMSELKNRIEGETFSTGGFVVFVQYTNSSTSVRKILVVYLKDTNSLSVADDLSFKAVRHIEFDKFHFAADISIDKIQLPNVNNISYIKGKQNADVAEYFKKFLGIEFKYNAKADTNLLHSITTEYLQSQTISIDSSNQIHRRIFDYCNERIAAKELITLDAISRLVNPDAPQQFVLFANNPQRERPLSNEFYGDKSVMKRFIRFSGQDKDVTIHFTNDVLGKRVVYDEKSDSLTISPIPTNLKSMLITNSSSD